MADTIAFAPRGKAEPEKQKKRKKMRGAGVMIMLKAPFVFCIVGNSSGMLSPQTVFGQRGDPA